MATGCAFCDDEGGRRLWRDARCRVVLADEPFPAFCRVVWTAHVREMTDLSSANRAHLMHIVYAVESALRARLTPSKMNLASLGNATPHVHWHVIPRFADDSHFPQSVWGPRLRDAPARVLPADFVALLAGDLASMLGASLAE